jgi:hypothetical protein
MHGIIAMDLEERPILNRRQPMQTVGADQAHRSLAERRLVDDQLVALGTSLLGERRPPVVDLLERRAEALRYL